MSMRKSATMGLSDGEPESRRVVLWFRALPPPRPSGSQQFEMGNVRGIIPELASSHRGKGFHPLPRQEGDLERRYGRAVGKHVSAFVEPGTIQAWLLSWHGSGARKEEKRLPITTREWLSKATLTKEMVNRFLDPDARNIWAFDSELGFRVRSCIRKDGVDGSQIVTHIEPSGERRMVNCADRPCRINTYGNSFNMSQQVSDGESWQEYLAAHLGEPIRNFGVGGYGVYQAYRRMLREERTESAAEYIVLLLL